MIEYIYFVKCPDCEDEHFDFFNDAKDFAMSCISKKPVITQLEVNRNDFGECTDHCDLGTVWSWEDAMADIPQDTVFSKAETFGCKCGGNCKCEPGTCKCQDHEFEDDDFFAMNEDFPLDETLKISFNNKADQQEFSKLCKETGMNTPADLSRFMKEYEADDSNLLSKLRDYKTEIDTCLDESITEAKADPFHEAIFEAIDYLTEFDYMFPVPENIGAANWEELKDDIRYSLSSDFEIAEIIMQYLDKDLAIGRKHPEMFEDDPQSELTLETYNRLKRAYDSAVVDYEAAHPEDFEESCGKPIKEGTALTVYDYDSMTKEELYDHIVNKNDMVDIDIGDRGYDFGEVRFSDGGRYSDSHLSVDFYKGKFMATEIYESDDGDIKEGDCVIEVDTFDELWDELMHFGAKGLVECAERKSVPEGMSIKDLVEAMEENEDTVECVGCEELFPKDECTYKDDIGYLCYDCEDSVVKCTWCDELFDRSECRREVDLGWLCSRCEMGIKSRGETLIFREGSYWDDDLWD